MSLDLRYFHLRNVIRECLNIESFEYCYLIPVLAQTAEYWGDAQVASTCNLLARQAQEYFNHAAHVHLYISQKDEHLNDTCCIYDQYHNIVHSRKINNHSKKYDSYLSKNDTSDHIDINQSYTRSHTASFFLHMYEKKIYWNH